MENTFFVNFIFWMHPSSTPLKLTPQPILDYRNSISLHVYSILVRQSIEFMALERQSDNTI